MQFGISFLFYRFQEDFEVKKNVKILNFEEDRGYLLGNVYVYRQSCAKCILIKKSSKNGQKQ